MRLDTLIKKIQPETVKGSKSVEIEGLAYDSRQVRPGFLFVALHGQNREGAEFLDDAVHRGAAAIVSEEPRPLRRDATQIQVRDARLALAQLACAYYGEPSSKLDVVGITGTNGKSTTSFMVRDILRAGGRTPGLLGTIRYEIGERCIPALRTTPEATDIQSMLDQMIRAGCRSVVMEVSSHGLVQKRTWGLDFDVAVFTNLTRDHLDYHETMENYFDAKATLFQELGKKSKAATAVINIDDPWGVRLAASHAPQAGLLTYGLHPEAMMRAEEVHCSAEGSSFWVASPWGRVRFQLKVLGRFNISNALAATAACGALGIKPETSAEVLASMKPAPGRLEQIPNERGALVFVDYAHTDDALANVLQTLREITKGRLIAVFGCGGRRDRAKRPLMGAVAGRMADFSIVTSDNPRNEDPVDIIVQVAAGFGFSGQFEMELDRRKAIARALSMAREGDTVLIAGKGHENYQEFANTIIPFDDRDVVRELLRNMGNQKPETREGE
ncbi:MAG TPA: UDP-N-acetylmuramoyl-L-alanyl-D-glutamate--2,6-diaminopimelate ligase [Verrucomicrobia bacterium]|nr:MAG: UDP-N-acetylmuramoyl-L-alanyl-D-glutamate--2,6-diaminopimelate ligase [Lentisphaerae bacterium GWF2_57_35]HBA83519.1 UDP-N-acetylmuramoyl-L-alanyl-D-glutamate--2,6-diaminopimelate ligase [Verrucomicrobiota bacterium]